MKNSSWHKARIIECRLSKGNLLTSNIDKITIAKLKKQNPVMITIYTMKDSIEEWMNGLRSIG